VVQAFAIQAGATRILVDPGVGDGKPRPEIPAWSGMRSGFLDRLSAAGFARGAVDVVLVTHLHLDHVGWLTSLAEDRSWVPTFPGARHVLVDRELDYWLGRPAGPSPDAHAAIDDSVRPVVTAGLVERVAPSIGVFLLSPDGRISRSQYWLKWALPVFVIGIALALLVFVTIDDPTVAATIIPIFDLIILWPGIAILIKRSHDRDRSGWFILLFLVPLLNFWPLIELLFLRGTIGSNRFGPDPVPQS